MQDSQKTSRVEWVDVLKFICIFFVMCSHTDASGDLSVGFFPFFLIGFFFASGYVYKRAPFKVFIKKKLLGILLPWGIFAILIPLAKNLVTGGDVSGVLLGNVLQIRSYGDSLWYLAALFITFIPFYFIEKYLPPLKAVILSAVLAVISVFYTKFCPAINYNILSFSATTNALPWHLEVVLMANFFMILGRYYKGKPEEFTKKFVKPRICVLTFAAYLGIIIPYYIFTGTIFGLGSYGPEIYSFFIWMAAVFLGLSAVIILSKLIKTNKFILYVGANTLLFYVIHISVVNFFIHLLPRFVYGWGAGASYTTVNIVFDYVFDKLIDPYPELYTVCGYITHVIVYFSNTLVSMLFLIVPSFVINNFAPFILGKKYPLRTKVYARRVIKKIFKKDLIQMKDEVSYAENRIKDLYERGKIKNIVIVPSLFRENEIAKRICFFSEGLGLKAEILHPMEKSPVEEAPKKENFTYMRDFVENFIEVNGQESFEKISAYANRFADILTNFMDFKPDCYVTIGKSAEVAVNDLVQKNNSKKGQSKKIRLITIECEFNIP